MASHKTCMQETMDVLYERHRSFMKHKTFIFRLSRLKRKQDACIRTMKALTNELITKKRVEFKKESASETLLDFLLGLEVQGVSSEKNTVDEINGIIFGGYSTLVNSLTFILVMIGSNPEVQERVYTEIQNVLSDSTREVNMDDLNNFIYLHAVILEVLRLYPVVSIITRKTKNSMDLSKYAIDPGSNCMLFIHAMNRHHSWGADRGAFKPERWLDGTSRPPYATFGLGRRSCIGKKKKKR
ncbi:cytochrome P450 4c21-like [Ostrinia furnacalis]|uniref:cytochrome P450 4c21-like n=1 Tax=Ostrinia furnacalis TaxID=93504 RepID=UPI001038E1AD|nr:cytochrome P450 4c21-like [Ostrinia furnacalis]